MIRLTGLRLPLEYNNDTLLNLSAKKLKISPKQIKTVTISRRSVDARNKADIFFNATLDIELVLGNDKEIIARSKCKNADIYYKTNYIFPMASKNSSRPVVVGAGPAGLFCAYILAKAGLDPIIIERGQKIEDRVKSVENFWRNEILDPKSNVQFGEGGAGTFSDGKLNTGIKDSRISLVLQLFVECGAPNDILYLQKPHIGTDILRSVIVNLRKKIECLGGEFRFETKMERIITDNNAIKSIIVSSNNIESELQCNKLVLAIGHSARDTFYSLHNSFVPMTQKPFAVGVRIEHTQEFINRSQYGAFYNHKSLSAADYKLAVHLPNGRGVYTFCMCPGGYVVAAASEPNMIATNGMSNYARDNINANSAVLVGVTPEDFGSDHPLAGIEFQRKIERAAYNASGSYKAPAQTVGSFLKGLDNKFTNVFPTYLPSVVPCDLHTVLPSFVSQSLADGLKLLDNKIKGFADDSAVLTAPETRSSSPVRILRNDNYCSDIIGVYPCGEGAGYAGGITSAAVDGIKCAEKIILQ